MNISVLKNLTKSGFAPAIRILSAIVALVVGSKLTIFLHPVPITLQTFVLYMIILTMSPREAFSAALGWMFLGVTSLPIFTSHFGGPTSGYIIGMVVAAPICAFIAKKTASSLLAFMSCYIIVHVFGCVWLANFVGWKSVFVLGVVPFVISEILKISLVCAMKPGISRLLKKI